MVDSVHPRLAFTTAGSQDNPAVLLLHGFMSSNAQWLANIDALSNNYYLVMVELWGHGDSPTPEDSELYSVDAYVSQFETIRAELNISKWGVIGQSYGAGLIINYALAQPDVCPAVVATNSRSAFGQLTNNSSASSGARKEREEVSAPFDPRKLPYHPIHARRFPPEIKDALVSSADNITADAIRFGGLLGQDLHSVDAIAALEQPLLITNGKYEKSFQPELNLLIDRYPTLKVAHLEGGHSVNIEAADTFNAVVADFLRTHLD